MICFIGTILLFTLIATWWMNIGDEQGIRRVFISLAVVTGMIIGAVFLTIRKGFELLWPAHKK